MDKHCPALPLAQTLLLQPIHPTPAISHSHLVLVLQRPSVQDNPDTEISPEAQLIFKDGHHSLKCSAMILLGFRDQSIECCKGSRELEPHHLPFPQGEAYTPISTILSFSALTELLGCCAEKDQPIHLFPNIFLFRPYLIHPAWAGRVKEKGCQHQQHLYQACPCPKAGRERSDGEEHPLTPGLLSAIICPFHSLLGSTCRGTQTLPDLLSSLPDSNKAFLDPPDPHHDTSPTYIWTQQIYPDVSCAGYISICT